MCDGCCACRSPIHLVDWNKIKARFPEIDLTTYNILTEKLTGFNPNPPPPVEGEAKAAKKGKGVGGRAKAAKR